MSSSFNKQGSGASARGTEQEKVVLDVRNL